uniref:helix-turn-helix domain-containing protein n=1 Tax=Castellaniella defragrans TaxID=75697 RepID=UPI00333E2E65
MLFDRVVLAWTDQEGMSDRLVALSARGFDVQVLPSPEAVVARGRQRAQEGAFTPVLLEAIRPQARMAIGWLRAQLSDAALVTLMQTAGEGEQLALLRMGADWICRPDESADLLVEVLLALWRRHLGGVPVANESPSLHGWTLRGSGWTLEGPSSQRISLTAGERAVLMVLFNAPGLTARHGELRAALDAAYHHLPEADRPVGSLGIVVSRLRAKGRRADLAIPIYAVYGQRYVFEPPELTRRRSDGKPGAAPNRQAVLAERGGLARYDVGDQAAVAVGYSPARGVGVL